MLRPKECAPWREGWSGVKNERGLGFEEEVVKKKLPVRELNPGHPRDRQVY